MKIEHINPGNQDANAGYTQVVAATATKTLYVAGQGAYDSESKLVGPGDHEAQTRQTCRNLVEALAAAGAKPEQVVFSTIYVAGLTDDTFNAVMRGMKDENGAKVLPPNAATLVGVERLAYEEMLIEISAIAIA